MIYQLYVENGSVAGRPREQASQPTPGLSIAGVAGQL